MSTSESLSSSTTAVASSHKAESSSTMEDQRLQAEAAYRWGKTPSSGPTETDPARLPADHPVHKIPPETQEKMRKKGINPVLRAEMDEATKGQGKERRFWSKFGLTSTGPWMR
ncbi:ADP-ribosyl-[dinitrogen reductase] glycohydrolase [Purpureocillium lavendulum]|uniref:ADP-ribosyl-[dinitrogen reductase] glycohydrolase n=1 Tax=Purpureocillium lavendulum TaxID=1247861 RepID=A0AB34FKA4_9HYPO|nr:ADP-ribosyl-[dinitrogen reductase] glycohydrolase [Purpureocillium lavendulum]